jgi:transcription antitermination factor NusG
MNTSATTPRWYVLYTRPKFEKKIAEEIRSMDYECYLPMRVAKRQWSDRVKTVEEPLFMNYVFVKTALRNRVPLLEINGVAKFVSIEGKPVPIPDPEIEKIKLIESRRDDIHVESYYSPGDRVKVIEGVFFGIEGVLIRKLRFTRLLIRLPLLRQAVSVEMEERHVMKII